MAKLTSVEDLDRLRASRQQAQRVARATSTQIFVGMGTCGIAAGARETMAAIREELARRGIVADVTSVGCIGICSREPLVDIQQGGQPRVTYANVGPDMVPRIIEEHLVRGAIVREWVFARLPVDGL